MFKLPQSIWLFVNVESQHHILPNGGQIKAVLIAGSKGYSNFRHQADVCHAYHILRENGIPDENIIVMMYDDIAYNPKNPYPGVIVNRPGGPNVYENVRKDYVGMDVSKRNLFNVLLGNKEAMRGIGSGRVLESRPSDHVFINFVDHGGEGVLFMPHEMIMASEFIQVLEQMAYSSRFRKMFLYIEACVSGSVFDYLLSDKLNIFVLTAADPHESSFSCFCFTEFLTCLGDVFSVYWMQSAETEELRTQSVNHHFQGVRSKTNTSHVQEYGDIDSGSTMLSEVIGYRDQLVPYYNIDCVNPIPSIHVPLAIIKQRIKNAKSLEEKKRWQKELKRILEGRKEVAGFFYKVAVEVIPHSNIQSFFRDTELKKALLTKGNLACYENTLTHLNECFNINENIFVASQLHKLVHLCNVASEADIIEKINLICLGHPKLKDLQIYIHSKEEPHNILNTNHVNIHNPIFEKLYNIKSQIRTDSSKKV